MVDDWSAVKGQFCGLNVVLRLHRPDHICLRERNETGINDVEDLYYNEMKVLRKLHHANIIKMFAFQENHVPCFCVLEDYEQTNLQVRELFL